MAEQGKGAGMSNVARLTVGKTSDVLVADASQPLGFRWADLAPIDALIAEVGKLPMPPPSLIAALENVRAFVASARAAADAVLNRGNVKPPDPGPIAGRR